MRSKTKLFSVSGALALAAFVGLAPTADACVSRLMGRLTTEAVPCETMCTEGPLTGGLEGTLEWTMDVMEETDIPDVVRYEGVNTITTDSGTLVGPDVGYWNLVTGEFVDFMQFETGTGEYEGARGHLTIVGKFDPETGTGSSRYIAKLREH